MCLRDSAKKPSADRGADAHDVASSLSLHCPVDSRAGDAEQASQPVVDVNPFVHHPECDKALALGSQVPLIGCELESR